MVSSYLISSENLELVKELMGFRCLKKVALKKHATTFAQALESLARHIYDLVFLDIELVTPDFSLVKAINMISKIQPFTKIVILASKQDIPEEVVDAIKNGAANYLPIPIDQNQLKAITLSYDQVPLYKEKLDYMQGDFWEKDTHKIIYAKGENVQKLYKTVRLVAPTDITILLDGETGTGKGFLAKLIVQHSKRKTKPFFQIHCGAIPESLLESELFGHEQGSFTGAQQQKKGLFELANGGTILLDEIATISSTSPIKLLQVLQDRFFYRIGGSQPIHTDVRIIAATNKDLKKMIAEEKFREDLYYRLNVFQLTLPKLSERVVEMESFVQYFISNFNERYNRLISKVDHKVMTAFKKYHWPGNIRELENVIERAYILEQSNVITSQSIPVEIMATIQNKNFINSMQPLKLLRQKTLNKMEQDYLKELLYQVSGKIQEASKISGLGVRQLQILMRKHGIKSLNFKAK